MAFISRTSGHSHQNLPQGGQARPLGTETNEPGKLKVLVQNGKPTGAEGRKRLAMAIKQLAADPCMGLPKEFVLCSMNSAKKQPGRTI